MPRCGDVLDDDVVEWSEGAITSNGEKGGCAEWGYGVVNHPFVQVLNNGESQWGGVGTVLGFADLAESRVEGGDKAVGRNDVRAGGYFAQLISTTEYIANCKVRCPRE